MLHLAGRAASPEEGITVAQQLLRSGSAYTAWLRIVEAQGGDTTVFKDPLAQHKPAAQRTVNAAQTGFLSSMDCKQVGWAVQRLGAGRARPGDPVSAHAGIEMHAKLGDHLESGQPIVTLFAEDPARLDEPEHMLRETLTITSTPPPDRPLILQVLSSKNL